MKLISVVTPCYNEEKNVTGLYNEVKNVFADLKNYRYEHIFIDNASIDNTVNILKSIAAVDKNVKIIVNLKNYGHLKSPFYAILQANGDFAEFILYDSKHTDILIGDVMGHGILSALVGAGLKSLFAGLWTTALIGPYCSCFGSFSRYRTPA